LREGWCWLNQGLARVCALDFVLVLYWNRKVQGRSMRLIRIRPQAPSMAFDDGATDRQPHAHAVGFGRKKRVEQLVRIIGVDAGAEVSNRNDYLIGFVQMRSDQKLPWRVGYGCHGLDSVHDQIDDHLLQLDPIATHGGQPRCEIHLERHVTAYSLTLHQ